MCYDQVQMKMMKKVQTGSIKKKNSEQMREGNVTMSTHKQYWTSSAGEGTHEGFSARLTRQSDY